MRAAETPSIDRRSRPAAAAAAIYEEARRGYLYICKSLHPRGRCSKNGSVLWLGRPAPGCNSQPPWCRGDVVLCGYEWGRDGFGFGRSEGSGFI
jgi:hypothetical protein